ncbi:LysR family transcriptional regulator [Staphylococcus sp. 18_1_E_LY]|uniref:LysR family transcriptional regulator n=1 Tax=Staphylococcus lloydii TaxID=2781774 RepID=A0A7T1B0A5_9STAP|nr:LysR family transcriptional regulator [Staphylococcus lloydii]MBF7020041.1 LysR family transcriptional regulator [Staphylococcus lloydii]MBF7027724.1 LysR family transcriptional regulator [Staphylococcus lloydii]QPM75404.1 LysR family transcriptional regulator [Staphylococcus lloydii]
MELRVLHYFSIVAQQKNITKAANTLHITQPTLSRQLKQLEEELDVKLFNRKNHNISLTEEGELLNRRSRELLDMSNKIQEEFKVIDKPIEGDIYLGCGETKGMKYIADIFKRIQINYPNIKLHIFSGNAEDIAYRLDKGFLDFGIFIEPVNLNKYESLSLPTYDQWGVIARRDSHIARKECITKEEVSKLPLICSRQAIDTNQKSNEFIRWFGELYSQLNIVATFNLAYNAGLLAQQEIGYVLTLDSIINTSSESNLCFVPFQPILVAKHNIVWRKSHHFSKAAQIFMKELKNVLIDE